MMKGFDALGVGTSLVKALSEQGIDRAFPVQQMTIPDALAGRDVCGMAKTGSGKTLAFGLPTLQRVGRAEPRRPRALILVPTRELATQVCDELAPLGEAVGTRVTAVYGGADIGGQIKRLAQGTEVAVVTPGRMIDLVDRKEVFLADVDIVVVDEADRMADMGFLPQVEWLLRHIEGTHQTLLFSATLDGAVKTLVNRYQTDPVRHEVASPQITVEEMTHRFLLVHEMDKVKVVAAIARASTRTLVFCRTKRYADRLVTSLKDEGVKAGPIHGDLPQRLRERSLGDFASGKQPVLVATDVAARGIHVDDVDVVIHADPPEDHKAYLHRSGRTARAGEEGLVVTLALWNEELEVRRLQKRIGIDLPIVEIFSNDARLADLAGWDPTADSAA